MFVQELTLDKKSILNAYNSQTIGELIANIEFQKLEEVGAYLAELHNEGEIDCITLLKIQDWGDKTRRDRARWNQVLRNGLGDINGNTDQIIECIYKILDGASVGNTYYPTSAFERWVNQNPNEIIGTLEIIESGNRDSELLSTALFALASLSPSDALSQAIKFSHDHRDGMRGQAISLIGATEPKLIIQSTDARDRLIALSQSANSQDEVGAIRAIIRLSHTHTKPIPEFVKTLDETLVNPSNTMRHELIVGLSRHTDAFTQAQITKIIELIAAVDTDSADTLQQIDYWLHDTDMEAQKEELFTLLTAILGQQQKAPGFDHFTMFTDKLMQSNHELIAWYLTKWLLDGQFQICNKLGSVFPPLDQGIYHFTIESFDLSEDEIFYLSRKIFVYLMFCHGAAVSLLIACLSYLSVDQRKRLEIDIAEFWFRNFPSDLKLFKQHYETYKPHGLKASINRMQNLDNAYRAPLQELKMNPALRPSTLERRVQGEIAYQQQKEIRKEADKQSVLADLFHKSTLLYGRSSVTYFYPGNDEEPVRREMPLQTFETSSPLPRMDVLFPAHLNFLLFQFRRESRPA